MSITGGRLLCELLPLLPKGTRVKSLERQSMSKRLPRLPMAEMYWSITPQGVSAKSCSAFWQRSALVTPGVLREHSCSRKVAIATSKEAELESPLPRGTLEAMQMLMERGEGRSSRYWKMVPLT